ncbi:MAG: class I SAM-dependent methyltransferase [Deltaproteobacteria bacterium]|nr:class I SAM-dependent methyltransferase [Deltaproteobacteria bacterium]
MSIPNKDLNIWEHSLPLRELCRRRALDLEPEMDCARQGAEILAPYLAGERKTVLDVGCGGGHFFNSLSRRGLNFDYFGLDYSPAMIEIARDVFKLRGLDPGAFMLEDVRDLHGFGCQIAVAVNTLSFIADYREPLQRLSDAGAELIVVRDNFGPETEIKWEIDGFLDPGSNHLKGYWNRWSVGETREFLQSLGYDVSQAEDDHCRGRMELVVEKPYHWSWMIAKR